MKSIYIAGPLFTEGERYFLEKVEEICSKNGFKTYLPHRDVNQTLDSNLIFSNDINLLDDVDIIIGVLDGPDIDSGTAFELGYGYSKGKKLIGIKTDYRAMAFLNRKNPLSSEVNLMVRFSLDKYCKNIKELEMILVEEKGNILYEAKA
jgi:nucleoside 2-deoxyribosyltransferase